MKRIEQANENLKRIWTDANGLQLHALVSKKTDFEEKLPVILVQGLGISSKYMIPAMSEIEKWAKVYAPDLPGFGESEKPRQVFNITELADVLADWMKTFGIKRGILVGHSFGCQVVAEFALRHSEMLDRAVFAAPTCDRRARSAFRQFGRLLLDALNEPFSLILLAVRDYLKFGVRRQARTMHIALHDRIEDKLPQINIPTLVIAGELDTVVPTEWAREVADLLPRGEFVSIPGTHGVNYQSPQVFAQAIRQFLDY